MAKIEPANLLLKDKNGNTGLVKSLTNKDITTLKNVVTNVDYIKDFINASGGSLPVQGDLKLTATDAAGKNGKTLLGTSKGTLTWGDKNLVRSVNGVGADANGNVQLGTEKLGTEKSTFSKVVYDTGYFSVGTSKSYSFDLTGSDLENVSKENVNIRLVAKVVTAHNGYEVGDIAQLTTAVDANGDSASLDVCSYIQGNTLYVYSGSNPVFSIHNGTGWVRKPDVQIKAVLTAFIPDDGSILLIAEDQTNTSKLIGLPDGTLTWGGKTIAPVTGEIKWFAFNTPPDGYLVCNGAEISRTTYADLFKAIGTTFGEGDGSTTFNIPDLRDRYIIGANTNALGTQIAEQLPNIRGELESIASDYTGLNAPANKGAFYNEGLSKRGANGSETWIYKSIFNANHSNSIYRDSGHVYPLSLALLPCIKY